MYHLNKFDVRKRICNRDECSLEFMDHVHENQLMIVQNVYCRLSP